MSICVSHFMTLSVLINGSTFCLSSTNTRSQYPEFNIQTFFTRKVYHSLRDLSREWGEFRYNSSWGTVVFSLYSYLDPSRSPFVTFIDFLKFYQRYFCSVGYYPWFLPWSVTFQFPYYQKIQLIDKTIPPTGDQQVVKVSTTFFFFHDSFDRSFLSKRLTSHTLFSSFSLYHTFLIRDFSQFYRT